MNKQVLTIKSKIKKLNNQLDIIQDMCQHEVVVGEYGADNGNLCRQDDSYWISATCQECGKYLYIDSKKESELYRKYSLSGMIK